MGFKESKIREVSFYFTVVSEGFFPFKIRKNWPDQEEKEPINFYPKTFLNKEEWQLFRFTPEEEKEILKKRMTEIHPPALTHANPLPPGEEKSAQTRPLPPGAHSHTQHNWGEKSGREEKEKEKELTQIRPGQ